jgi:ketosteroid isomerase-like protein
LAEVRGLASAAAILARMAVSTESFRNWLDGYFQAWVTNDPESVAALFTEDAVYWFDPFQEPRRGRDEIVRSWISGPQKDVEYTYEPLAVAGDVGVAHWRVSSRSPDAPGRNAWDGILLITFAPDGRCREHREWYSHRVR